MVNMRYVRLADRTLIWLVIWCVVMELQLLWVLIGGSFHLPLTVFAMVNIFITSMLCGYFQFKAVE